MNKITCKLLLLFFACVAIFSSVQAKVKMSALFADHMVLQRQSEVAIWGWADARSEVSVTTRGTINPIPQKRQRMVNLS